MEYLSFSFDISIIYFSILSTLIYHFSSLVHRFLCCFPVPRYSHWKLFFSWNHLRNCTMKKGEDSLIIWSVSPNFMIRFISHRYKQTDEQASWQYYPFYWATCSVSVGLAIYKALHHKYSRQLLHYMSSCFSLKSNYRISLISPSSHSIILNNIMDTWAALFIPVKPKILPHKSIQAGLANRGFLHDPISHYYYMYCYSFCLYWPHMSQS